MLRRVMMAGNPPAGSGHRYWRILISLPDGSSLYCGFTEIEFRESAGGPDAKSAQSGNGAASASSEVNTSNGAWMGSDGRLTHGWLSNTASASWWSFDFGNASQVGIKVADVKQVAIRGSFNAPAASPRDFSVQWSDDGAAWTNALTVTGQTGWTGASDIRVFDIP